MEIYGLATQQAEQRALATFTAASPAERPSTVARRITCGTRQFPVPAQATDETARAVTEQMSAIHGVAILWAGAAQVLHVAERGAQRRDPGAPSAHAASQPSGDASVLSILKSRRAAAQGAR